MTRLSDRWILDRWVLDGSPLEGRSCDRLPPHDTGSIIEAGPPETGSDFVGQSSLSGLSADLAAEHDDSSRKSVRPVFAVVVGPVRRANGHFPSTFIQAVVRMPKPQSIAILGGGISGLSAAYYLTQRSPETECVLFESAGRVGGMLSTTCDDGWLVEASADSFLSGPETASALELANEIGFADQLIETNSQHRRALVAFNGDLHAVPKGFQLLGTTQIRPVLDSTLLSRSGRLRLARERSIPPRTDGAEESLAEFARRRLGQEAFERLVQPLVAGIYSADPEKLSIEAALPRFPLMEREHGSLYAGLLARQKGLAKNPTENEPADAAITASGARYGLFQTPRHGMQSFVDAVVDALPRGTCTTNATATSVSPRHVPSDATLEPDAESSAATGPSGPRPAPSSIVWQVSFSDGRSRQFDQVILALPTHCASALVAFDPRLATSLQSIPYASVVVACVGLRVDQIRRPLDAFGVVVPRIARRRIIAVSFSSVKFPNRAPDGHALLRVFVGGACQPELTELDDDALQRLVRDELGDLLEVDGEPVRISIQRWFHSSPQYHIGHAARVAAIESALQSHPGLHVAGNAYNGVGIPQSVASGRAAAMDAIRLLKSG